MAEFNPPDKLSAFPSSPHYNKEWLPRVVIWLNGNPCRRGRAFVEYSISGRYVLVCKIGKDGKVVKWGNTAPVYKLTGFVQVFPSDNFAAELAIQ